MVSPDDVQSVLFDLRDRAGFDHLSRLTAQEYQDRYESVYRVTKYDERTHEVDIVVPTPRDDPRHESAAPVYSTADWHEREAYDLVGVDVRCPGSGLGDDAGRLAVAVDDRSPSVVGRTGASFAVDSLSPLPSVDGGSRSDR